MIVQKTYLGDAVYAEYDGYQIRLTTSNGESETNEIFLEPKVYRALVRFVAKLVGQSECAEAEKPQ